MFHKSRFLVQTQAFISQMARTIGFVGMLVLILGSTAFAQEWASKMFEETSHDFGTVAKDSDIEFRFKFKNIYKEDIHIASVASSCACTTVSVTKETLKTWETSEIVAKYNTNRFTGFKKATITVRIDRPYYAEVQLEVQGNIRTDVWFKPGKIDLGSVGQGNKATKSVTVSQRGRNNWRISKIKSNSDYVDVDFKETHRSFGASNYEISVTLKDNAPAGFLFGEVTLETNESNGTQIPIPFSGKVVPPIEVSPGTLTLGPLAAGEKVTKKILVKAKEPFKILDVSCVDNNFEVTADDTKKAIHFLSVSYTPDETQNAKTECVLQIDTDLAPGGVVKVPVIITMKGE